MNIIPNVNESVAPNKDNVDPVKEILSNPNVSSAELEQFHENQINDYSAKFQNSLEIFVDANLNDLYEFYIKDSAQESTIKQEIWEKLETETDIVQNWYELMPELKDEAEGIFVRNLESIAKTVGIQIYRGNRYNGGAYMHWSRSLEMTVPENTSPITDLLRPFLRAAGKLSQTVSDIFLFQRILSHELSHDRNVGTDAHKKLTHEELNKNAQKSLRSTLTSRLKSLIPNRRSLSDKYAADLSKLQKDLDGNFAYIFFTETSSDISESDVGASVNIANHTFKRMREFTRVDGGLVYGAGSVRDTMLQSNDVLNMERKMRALNALGVTGAQIGKYLTDKMLSDFEQNSKTYRDISEMVTFEYFDTVLTGFINQFSSNAQSISDPIEYDEMITELLKVGEAKSRIRKQKLTEVSNSIISSKIKDLIEDTHEELSGPFGTPIMINHKADGTLDYKVISIINHPLLINRQSMVYSGPNFYMNYRNDKSINLNLITKTSPEGRKSIEINLDGIYSLIADYDTRNVSQIISDVDYENTVLGANRDITDSSNGLAKIGRDIARIFKTSKDENLKFSDINSANVSLAPITYPGTDDRVSDMLLKRRKIIFEAMVGELKKLESRSQEV